MLLYEQLSKNELKASILGIDFNKMISDINDDF